MSLVFDTATVARRERLDFWVEVAAKVWFPTGFRHLGDRPFQGAISSYALGPLSVSRVVSHPTVVTRTPAEIARFDPHAFHLSMQVEGRSVISQDGRAAELRPGDLTIYDTSRPFTIRSPRSFELIVVEGSKAILGAHGGWDSPRTAEPIRDEVAIGLVAPFLRRLVDRLDDGSVQEADTDFGESALSLVRALNVDDTEPRKPTNRSSSTLLLRMKAYIEAHLGDADLGPDAIARAHYVSTRYLQKLFHAENLTVTGWIRDRRLARCRRDLRDPTLADDTILAIATRWGFTNAAHFSRAFRAAHGCSPREYRRRRPRAYSMIQA